MSSSVPASQTGVAVTQRVIDEIIQYYTDANAKHKAPRNKNGQLELAFGEVVQGRKTPPVSLFIKNVHSGNYSIRVSPETTDPDLKFAKAPPEVLMPGQVAEIQLVFDCPMTRITPLQANWGVNITVLPNKE